MKYRKRIPVWRKNQRLQRLSDFDIPQPSLDTKYRELRKSATNNQIFHSTIPGYKPPEKRA
jgi:hypothetical protein